MSETRGDFTRANFYVALMIKEPRLEIIIISDKILIYWLKIRIRWWGKDDRVRKILSQKIAGRKEVISEKM